jgi:flagellar biosynthesis chaperone FliJ
MTRVERMNKLADMAGDRKDEATLKLADRLRHVDAEEAQLADLHRFREEYIGSDSAATNVAACSRKNARASARSRRIRVRSERSCSD